jgi:fatty-acyl-CoA synthase
MKSTTMPCPLLVSSMLERGANLFPDVAIISIRPGGSRHSYTYRDLRRRSRQLAAALQRAGIAKGDRVATLMCNEHEHLEAYFAVPSIGAVLHTLNLRLHPDDLAYIVNHAQDRFLIVDDVLLDVLEQIRHRVQLERVFVVDHGCGRLPPGAEIYEALLAEQLPNLMLPISQRTMPRLCATPLAPPADLRECSIHTVRLPFIRSLSLFPTS